MLTKEKLRHYLAFECAIREIAAVSDRHCLATDNPRTSVATISLSHSLSLWARFTRAVRSLSRLHPSLLSPLHHSQLSRALYAACTYTNPPIAFSLALCLMNAHSNTLSRYPTRGKILSLAKTGHSREPLLPRSVYHRFIIIRITRLCLVPLILRFLGFVASRKTRQLFHPFRKASSIVSKMFNERELFASTTRNLFGFLLF